MELPNDIQSIIHEFARPVTRPDWRTLHKLSLDRYLILVKDSYTLDHPLHHMVRKIRKILFKDIYDL
jgi:hypothetical protein